MREQVLDRPLPHSAENERAILGAAILDNPIIGHAGRLLTPDDFYVRAHRHIFVAMLALAESGSPVDPFLLSEQLKACGQYEQVGGIAFISELSFGIPHFVSIAPHARIIREMSRRRRLAHLGNLVTAKAVDSDESSAEIAAWAGSRIFDLSSSLGDGERRGPVAIADKLHSQMARYEQFHLNVSDTIPTGFGEIDDSLTGRGLARTRLTLIGARPSFGKTSLALDITANAARRGFRPLFFSLEMGAEQLLDRLVAVESGIPRWKIQAGLSRSDLATLVRHLPTVCDLPILFDDNSRKITAIRREVRERMRREETRPDLIVVDYLQLVVPEGKHGSRNDAVGSVSRELKGMAMEFDVPVLVLSQLSRECDKQKREPELSDLRDSGEAEQDADTVFLMFGDKAEEEMSFRNVTVKCAKQRDGKLFRVEMPFNGELVTFRDSSHLVNVTESRQPVGKA